MPRKNTPRNIQRETPRNASRNNIKTTQTRRKKGQEQADRRGRQEPPARRKRPQPSRSKKQANRRRHAPRPSVEARCLGVLVVSVMIFVFVFITEAGGAIGLFLRSALIGTVGAGAYVLPFALAIVGVSGFFSPEGFTRGRLGMLSTLFLCFVVFWSIPSVDVRAQFDSIGEYIGFYFGGGSVANGGLVGSAVANVFLLGLGTFGSYFMVLAVSLVLVAYLTRTSLSSVAEGIGQHIYNHRYKDDYFDDDDYEEEYDEHVPRELAKLHNAPPSPKRKPKLFTISGGVSEQQDSPAPIIAQEQTLRILRGDNGIIGIEDESFRNEQREVHSRIIPEYDAPPFDIIEPSPQPSVGVAIDDNIDDNIIEDTVVDDISINDIVIKENTNQFIDITGGDTPEPPPLEPQGLHVPIHNTSLEYAYPPIDLLRANPNAQTAGSRASILENSRKLEDTLKSFGVEARVVEVSKGPTVTRYELSPGTGVKVSRISALADDLALNLAAVGIRIEAPIPGKAAVGIEIPNKEISAVHLREVIEDEAFKSFPSKLAFALGKDIAGNTIVADIAKMPHLLIAGATGSGKSVCINTLVTSIIYKASPDEVKLLMIDPKVVELSIYNGIPHLLIPVVTEPKKAAGALFWAVQEMVRRYNLFAETAVRDLKGYNAILAKDGDNPLPQIVIIIDELADLMMVAPGDVEDSICRLAQMARAAGLHLIIATQRPSVDVITGLIKANVPSRLAFAVSSGTDSRTILDQVGAERLLGKGDMLFNPVGLGKPQRIQGAFVSDKEVEDIVSYIKSGDTITYDNDVIDRITQAKPGDAGSVDGEGMSDELFDSAAQLVISKEKASASMLQRQFRIGYNRASRLIEELEEKGVVGPEDGAKPRKVLMNAYQWQEFKGHTMSN